MVKVMNMKINYIIINFIIILIAIFMFTYIKVDDSYENVACTSQEAFGTITKENELIQQILVQNENDIESIDILLATYMRDNTSNYTICLYVNDNNILSKSVNSRDIQDNSFYRLDNLKINISKDDKLYLYISSDDANDSNGITAWKTKSDKDELLYRYNRLTKTIKKDQGSLRYRVIYKDNMINALSNNYIIKNKIIVIVLLFLLFQLVVILAFRLIFKR